MKVNGKNYRTVWMEDNSVFLIEQNLLPYKFKIVECKKYLDTCIAIKTMVVRGAGAIGAAAGYAMAQAALEANINNYERDLYVSKKNIEATRPTAQNLFGAVQKVYDAALISPKHAVAQAQAIADKDADDSKKIGEYGNTLIQNNFKIETHCNAGWLAFVDNGTALSPIYEAHKQGKNIFVWVDETRPRGQGAKLTAWELLKQDVPFKIIPDNAGAHLMSLGQVDMMIVGADRIALNGDAANKIGTLEKAIACKEYGIPFYVAAPTSTIDVLCLTGKNIPIEERSENEVLYQTGTDENGKSVEVLVCTPGASAFNPAFDVTPAKFITGIITEKGIIKPNKEEILKLFE